MPHRHWHPAGWSDLAAVFLSLTIGVTTQAADDQELVSTSPLRRLGNQTAASIADQGKWSRVYIRDPYVRDAVRQALGRAGERLQTAKCQSLLTEFSDRQGRALTERLADLRMTLADYVDAVIVEDADRHPRCGDTAVLAFTVVGSRRIYVCGAAFVRASRRDLEEVNAALVHELLHSLGLGENPPSPRQITHRVKELCW